jgi:hypothetical protein
MHEASLDQFWGQLQYPVDVCATVSSDTVVIITPNQACTMDERHDIQAQDQNLRHVHPTAPWQ